MPSQRRQPRVPCNECIERAATLNAPSEDVIVCNRCAEKLTVRMPYPVASSSPVRRSDIATTPSHRLCQPAGSFLRTTPSDDAVLGYTAETTVAIPPAEISVPRSHPPDLSTCSESTRLQDLTRRFVNAVNERDFLNPVWYCARVKIQVSHLDNFTPANTLSDNIKMYQQIIAESPQYHLRILGIDVLEAAGGETAETYVNMEVSGRPAGLTLESVGRMQWERHLGNWRLISFDAMRFCDPIS